MGATIERVLAKIGRQDIEQITKEDLEILIGTGTAIKEGQQSVDDAFPELPKDAPSLAPAEEGRRVKLGGEKKPVVTFDTSAVTSDPIT